MPDTTVMRDSIVGDQWIYDTAMAVPIQRVIDAKTGQPTGDFLTGPVRLTFETLFDLPPPSAKNDNPKFGAAVLFTPYADFTLLNEEYYRLAGEKFGGSYDAQTRQYYGLYSPFRQQSEKLKHGGYTPGLVFMSVTSKFKPPVVDMHGQPITDKAKVYPGVWAICGINSYTFEDPKKKGVTFGLQSVMIIGDDKRLGGGPADTKQMYGAVAGAIHAPVIAPGALSHLTGAAPPPSGVPAGHAVPPPSGGTYAPPPPPSSPAGPPGQYVMPGRPAGPPPAAVDPRGPVPPGFGSWGEYDALMNG